MRDTNTYRAKYESVRKTIRDWLPQPRVETGKRDRFITVSSKQYRFPFNHDFGNRKYKTRENFFQMRKDKLSCIGIRQRSL